MVAERLGSVEREEKTKLTNADVGAIEYVNNPIDDVKALQKFLELGDVKFKCNENQRFQPAYVNLAGASRILKDKDEYIRQMIEWLAKHNFQWRLCYRASLHGWEAEDFHSRCDNKGPTVVFVQVGKFIFGGFTDKNWSADAMHMLGDESGKSFIFSLLNNDSLPPFKSFLRESKCSIYQNSSYGAIFGRGYQKYGRDLSISINPHSSAGNNASFSDFGHSYTLPEGYVAGSDKARSLLAGGFNFTPTEVEVFY